MEYPMRQAAIKRVPIPTATHTHDDIKRLVKRGRVERSKAFRAALAGLFRALRWLAGRT